MKEQWITFTVPITGVEKMERQKSKDFVRK